MSVTNEWLTLLHIIRRTKETRNIFGVKTIIGTKIMITIIEPHLTFNPNYWPPNINIKILLYIYIYIYRGYMLNAYSSYLKMKHKALLLLLLFLLYHN
jgi:hypothetical protein